MALPNMTEISNAIRGLMPQLRPTPVGLIGYFHDIPDGWLLCNGAAVSRTTYAKLFNVIGTRYGEGDGSTTFNLPNLEGRFLESTTDVSKLGQYVEAGLPDISGVLNWTLRNSKYGKINGVFTSMWADNDVEVTIDVGSAGGGNRYMSNKFSASGSSGIYKNISCVQPQSLRLMPCIRS